MSGIASGAGPAQTFNFDFQYCLGGTVSVPPLACSSADNTALGAFPGEGNASKLDGGNRLTLTYSWHGPGWYQATDADYAAAGFTSGWNSASQAQVGGISSQIDLLCDGSTDIFEDNSNVTAAGGVPEQVYWRGPWNSTQGRATSLMRRRSRRDTRTRAT